ncbi:unnamed protein product [Urochloa humidicola]
MVTIVANGRVSSAGTQLVMLLSSICEAMISTVMCMCLEVQMPEFLGSFHELRYLDLSQSSLVGRIPPQLGNLSNLRYLKLDSIFGETHSVDITWLPRLSSLEHLDMSWVNLSTIMSWVNNLPSLHFE